MCVQCMRVVVRAQTFRVNLLQSNQTQHVYGRLIYIYVCVVVYSVHTTRVAYALCVATVSTWAV